MLLSLTQQFYQVRAIIASYGNVACLFMGRLIFAEGADLQYGSESREEAGIIVLRNALFQHNCSIAPLTSISCSQAWTIEMHCSNAS